MAEQPCQHPQKPNIRQSYSPIRYFINMTNPYQAKIFRIVLKTLSISKATFTLEIQQNGLFLINLIFPALVYRRFPAVAFHPEYTGHL